MISLALAAAVAVAPKPVKLVLKPGQAVAFSVSVVDGKATPGPARLGEFGRLAPETGEVVVGLSKRDKDLYDQLVVVEKLSAPVDFVATGWVGEIKIDEREIAGKLDAPVSQRIGGTSWTVSLHDFALGK